jgi:Xaa-Pro dipeptidase
MGLDPARDRRNREVMASHQLDALICRLPENVLLLTGHWPLSSFAWVLFPREGTSTLIVPETEARSIPPKAADELRPFPMGILSAPDPYESIERYVRDAAGSTALQHARIGYEAGFEAVAAGHTGGEVMVPAAVTLALLTRALPRATLVDATGALHAARARKTAREIEMLRRANEIAAFGLEAFRALYEPGRTEAEVAAQVEAAIMTRGIGHRGAAHVRAWAQLMTGPEAAHAYSLHPATSARVIARGDLGVLELGTHVDGYWSDLTRTLVAGDPPDTRQQELYAAILAGHEAVMAHARPGMTGAEVDALARQEIERRGFGEHFFHPTGHGLGFRYHEPHPLLRPGSTSLIEEGMVSSVEPGIYIEGYGGMRMEENVAFTADGVERLSVFDTSLGVS